MPEHAYNDFASPMYPLGHSQDEFARLALQANLYADVTREVLNRAGIKRGMKVVDLGSGIGDVSLLAAKLVGPRGRVLGLDKSATAVGVAKARAIAEGLNNCNFEARDIETADVPTSSDLVVGRLILAYLSNAEDVVRRIVGSLKMGAVVAFQEINLGDYAMSPGLPLHDGCLRWIRQAFKESGLCAESGTRLLELLKRSGVVNAAAVHTARVETWDDAVAPDYFSETVRSMLPIITGLGIASTAEIGIDSLAARLRKELEENQGTIILPGLVSAWGYAPGL
ncbi:methyltransferase domain-containing protein [Streptomyces sp. NPDC086783]|uniref:methyltransferase domain-containing protein n=1 Tax=Streptomyces sp. NPDC086783 TaxID=3365758 RepID=UPI003802656B